VNETYECPECNGELKADKHAHLDGDFRDGVLFEPVSCTACQADFMVEWKPSNLTCND